ncbi:S8 family serine peptidase [Bordetella bronchialis]|uniref:P/Homo B domain-containing protein n=1 Tax=Bordetella bronchialis TaxID=463025 RepID=A0A193FPJ9_9BORD|nr:S8 family serine peptidase [Bordetella bronchialis]ANN69019.1 hypothetical protein BAU06_24355 [Bordetella bronchialis]ANN74169.1 hypothetical protein BAU08_24930 [Bordetella bronchialis]
MSTASAIERAARELENVPHAKPVDAAPMPARRRSAVRRTDDDPIAFFNKIRDPLYRYQWHLKNRGQYAVARDRPTPGVDLHIGDLHRNGITGKGVVVGVRELPGKLIDAAHEDLADNMVLPAHPGLHGDGAKAGAHATRTAGIIAARRNGLGGIGVAPDAKILDLGRPEARNQPRPPVVNESLGRNRNAFEPYRKGKVFRDGRQDAQLVVKAAGNEFIGDARKKAAELGKYPDIDTGAQVGRLSANLDTKGSRWNVLNVGAVNAQGIKASYSRAGSSIWVSGLGGESGLEEGGFISWADEKTPREALYAPALITTDVTDCSAGKYSNNPGPDTYFNALETGGKSVLDPNCRYMARFNGTSAAAPTVSGVAALMLQANPALTWRDIKYLLAVTARKVDADRAPIRWNGITLDDGWVANAARRSFSNWYGFGLVDAKRAVTAARGFRGLPPPVDSGWHRSIDRPVAIPYRDENAGYAPLRFARDMRVESVQIRLRTSHRQPHNLRIALISPSGTRSIVMPALTEIEPWEGKDGGQRPFSINRVATNAFLDENAKGVWKLQVLDVLDPSADAGKLLSWEIRVLGH